MRKREKCKSFFLVCQEARLQRVNDGLDFRVAGFEVVIDDDTIKDGIVLELHFALGGVETNLDGFLGLSSTITQASLELSHARRRDEDEVGIEFHATNRLASLDIEIEEAKFSGLGDGLNGRESGAVASSVHLSRLDELSFQLELLEPLVGHKVIRNAIDLTNAGPTGRMGDRVTDLGGILPLEPFNDYGIRSGRDQEIQESSIRSFAKQVSFKSHKSAQKVR